MKHAQTFLILGVCLFAGAEAIAQPATADVLVVTASRTAEARQDTSAPISVLSAAELEQLSAHHSAEAINQMPGAFVNRGNGVEHLTAIRSPVFSGGAAAGSFLFLEDGIPLRAPGFGNINALMESVDGLSNQIEMIRGPGAAVYGSNAMHGLINLRTPDPLRAPSRIQVEAGSFGRAQLRAQSGGQTHFGSAWAGVSYRHEDGWREDAGLDQFGVQARLDSAPGRTTWSLRASLIDIDQETATFAEGFEAYKDEALSQQNLNPEAYRNVRAARVNGRVSHDLSDRLSAELVGYARTTDMDFRMHFLPGAAQELSGHDSVGFQSSLTWQSDNHRVMVGLDGDFSNGYLYEYQDQPTMFSFIQGLHYDYEVDAAVLGGFVQSKSNLGERVRVEAGLRLEHTAYDYDNHAPDGVIGRYLRPADRSDDFSFLAPNLGVMYQASDTLDLVVRGARGARAPQTGELYRLQPGQEVEGIEPETLDSFELGLRWLASEGSRFELTAFSMFKRNVFFRDADGFNVTDGKTRHRGIELDARFQVTQTLGVATSLTWAEHEYAFDRPVSSLSSSISDGDLMDTAPKWLWNMRLNWQPSTNWSGQVEWAHVGEYFADPGNTARYDGHDIFNARLAYTIDPTLQIAVKVRNVFDTRYAERADFSFGDYRYFPAEPRGFSLSLTKKY